ncbi:MAG TPA: Pls/PosA family non-ribosomal peptide synthetase [Pseudonocardia sp.]|uniref:Pls/PosA family non-ribosomal peptide synthetase n=1 Tax=Pseudonocardia sp. TaxID=60912 RepID=UPI002C2C6D1F|nr:Pls/PosA family non-ribosomal peptide synthetase [Pseudonocardia sp.]HTF52376.1 Pls/PosA family non-ribosomal peptide synthetase [Pseudonocardia sp.]
MGESVEVLTVDVSRSATTLDSHAGPTTGTEGNLAEVLAEIVHVERVSVDSHFFDDLGADSMVMARFCARVRKRPDLPSVSMKDIYRNPTIKSLATALAVSSPIPIESLAPAPVEAAKPASTLQYVLCGALQFLIFLGYAYLAGVILERGYEWISIASNLFDIYLRSALFGGAAFLGLCLLPILAKWLLVGRWKPQQIRIWSVAYVRFWTVKTLIRLNPLVLFVGSPLYVLYLRALGAKVGRGVAIFSQSMPVCTDLLTIGDGTVIRKDSSFSCYRAHAGMIQTGAVILGKDVLVSEATVLDIETSMGDGAQLGHASSLHRGQAVPNGERWHGSPALRSEVDYRTVDSTHCGILRKVIYSVLQLLTMMVLFVPLAIGGVVILLADVPQLARLLDPGHLALATWTFYRDALVASVVLFFGLVFVGLLVVVAVPRVLSLAIKPERVYCLYGLRYWIHQSIVGMTNIRFFAYLFGDSSYIVHFLRCLGYDLSQVEQTGSNFGLDVKHEMPYLSTVGTGTMVADGLSMINADFSSTSFRVSRVSIGPRNFIGNYVAYPSQARTGDNCLLATKVMVPVDGEVREGVGLLGSPSFEIPRSVERDSRFDHLKSGDMLRRRLAAKNKHNAVTMGLYLLVWWISFFVVALLALSAVDLYRSFGALPIALFGVVSVLFVVVYFTLVERAATAFRALRPQYCSIYEPHFWWHERYWKLSTQPNLLNGTPFKGLTWRMLGVRLGRRVFDDGCIIMEKTLVRIGDDCTFNAGSIIQCHSQEDGAFKSDRITIGAGCTLGVGALVHYGTTIGDRSVLAPDSFLMKGEEMPQRAEWGGNPAREMRNGHALAAVAQKGRRDHLGQRGRVASSASRANTDERPSALLRMRRP